MSQLPENTRELDVLTIPGPQRHTTIFGELNSLDEGASLVIKADHNPLPLRQQVDYIFAGEFEQKYLEEGPEVYRLCFTRIAPSKGNYQAEPPSPFKSTLPVKAQ